jgi:hypothetical protein
MKQVIFFLLVIIFFSACRNNTGQHRENLKRERNDLSNLTPIVSLTPIGDTTEVLFDISGIHFKINYFKGKPQYILIDRDYLGSVPVTKHFAKDHKGLYVAFNDSGFVQAFGIKYFNGNNGIDVLTDDNFRDFENIGIWSQYLNNGKKINLSQLFRNKIITYDYNAGDLIDSSIYVKK